MKQINEIIDGIQEKLDLLRQIGDIRVAEKQEPERNADGDTLDILKEVAKQYQNGGVECLGMAGEWERVSSHDRCFLNGTPFDIRAWRITAKHADHFDPECMDPQTFAEAVIGRGEIIRQEWDDGEVWYADRISECKRGLIRVGNLNGDIMANWGNMQNDANGLFTAITRAKYEQETAPKHVPWDAETFPPDARLRHKRWGKKNGWFRPISVCSKGITIMFSCDNWKNFIGRLITFEELLENYVQHDDTPCGELNRPVDNS